MRKISSEVLGVNPVSLGEQAGELHIYDNLSTPVSDDVIVLSEKHQKEIADFAQMAAQQYGDRDGNREQTLAQRACGVPSLIVRVDATIHNGTIHAYEMEDSPSGLGITDRIHRRMAGIGIRQIVHEHYIETVGEVPKIVVSGKRGHGTDDEIIFGENYIYEREDTTTLPEGEGPVIIKTIPGDSSSHEPYLGLQSRAVAPLVTEGDKSYLERIGALKAAPAEDDLLIDSEGNLVSQVVKARQGSMAMGVALHLTSADRKRFTNQGTVTASKLRKLRSDYEEHRGGALVQPFVPPIQIENKEGRKNAILRVFVLLGRKAVPARVIGGCYVARPPLLVHGASDGVSGAVLVYNGEQS